MVASAKSIEKREQKVAQVKEKRRCALKAHLFKLDAQLKISKMKAAQDEARLKLAGEEYLREHLEDDADDDKDNTFLDILNFANPELEIEKVP